MTVPERLARALAGRYQVERELGRGGMATVYLAHDVRHDRAVAIKLLLPQADAAHGTERFLREIRIAARLHHPHILPVYDSGALPAEGGRGPEPYFVMPYVQGESLAHLLARENPLAVAAAVRIASEVADALGHAHAQGIVHRDVKPGNILIDAGHAVVADFGIARAVSAAAGDRMTATGVAMGTPAYMSPEQVVGADRVDARSDVYSLGCVLHEMLVGEPPFPSETVQGTLSRRLVETAPPVRQLRSEVPEPVEAALTRAMAIEPKSRFATGSEFAAALEGSAPTLVRGPVLARRRRGVMAAVG
ncbi:MAG: serine/threonine-protein kinase, partial [Gemmatimonadales bacterium]